jgi:hypothetical protein
MLKCKKLGRILPLSLFVISVALAKWKIVWFNEFLSVCNIMTCAVAFEFYSILTSIGVILQNDRKFEQHAFQEHCHQQSGRGDLGNTISQSIFICFTSFKKRSIA